MDAKEVQLIHDLARMVGARKFHERDVLALLILLREHAPVKSPLRELGDFVAHREKDRGALKTYVHHVVAYGEAIVKNTNAQLKISVVHSQDEFHESLNRALAKFELNALPADVGADVLTCAMSLLQDVRLHHGKAEIGRLALCRVDKDLWLSGIVVMSPKQARVVFPALIVPNRYCSPADGFSPFDGIVEAKCAGGRLHLYIGRKKAA